MSEENKRMSKEQWRELCDSLGYDPSAEEENDEDTFPLPEDSDDSLFNAINKQLNESAKNKKEKSHEIEI